MKRAAAICVTGALLCGSISASAFDWTALLNERKAMINESSMGIYYEGGIENAPYFGAKFEPRGGTYFGCVPENEGDFNTPPGAYLTFMTGASRQTEMYYPANRMISEGRALGVVEYTAGDFDSFDINSFGEAMKNLADTGVPILVSIMNEMNTNNMQYDSARYVSLFRQAADVVHRYSNLAVAWTPIAIGSLDKPFEEFYPGDEYVDWLGLTMFDIHRFQGKADTSETEASYFMTGNNSWATNRIKPFMQFVERNNIRKPIAIIQGGVANQTKASGNIDSWAQPRLRNMYYDLIMKYPQIKLINYFNVKLDNPENESFHFFGKPYLADIVDEAASCGAYITSYGAQPRFVFTNAENGGTAAAENGLLPIYTQVYIPGSETNTVSYEIDGAWYHSSSTAPYKCLIDMSALSDGTHTVKASSGSMQKTVTFNKNGNAVSFGTDSVSYAPPAADNDIKVFLDGREIAFDVAPIIENGRTLVPLRAIFEAMGAEVSWDQSTGTVTSKKGGSTCSLRIGANTIYVNGEPRQLDVPARIKDDRTLIPLRAVSEAHGCYVEWNGAQRTVAITSGSI